ncbi:hypothetical protein [Stratiformator vulcanicus]|uniref:Uncharacterized protein n=1 Tax=Stratiformator vulcanicus TaxID=2527980 RepID=A0A517R101_9PLAN|nr:hypothetical protein [Stratiformator vulcanicus]QDT37572.1 hypothetical protein Pan189_19520 [Stratiformator vulcanicus]
MKRRWIILTGLLLLWPIPYVLSEGVAFRLWEDAGATWEKPSLWSVYRPLGVLEPYSPRFSQLRTWLRAEIVMSCRDEEYRPPSWGGRNPKIVPPKSRWDFYTYDSNTERSGDYGPTRIPVPKEMAKIMSRPPVAYRYHEDPPLPNFSN